MGKMTLKLHNALKATLAHLQESLSGGILCYGEDGINKRTFCHPINLEKNAKRLLSCTRIEVHSIGHHPIVEQKFVEWLKSHIRLPTARQWCNLASPHNWLRYNIAEDLYLLHLGIAKVDYYLILREENLRIFRSSAFNMSKR
jgi:hypothetical protein